MIAARIQALLDSAAQAAPRVSLRPAIAASVHSIETADAGSLRYYADLKASGRPLLLLHGVHAAASSFEMGPLFEAFRGKRKLYALDLPGFGFSSREPRSYTPALYVRAIEHMLRHAAVRQPVDIIALSLTCEYAAQVALDVPELVRSLTLISPTGFAAGRRQSMLELLSRRLHTELPALSELSLSRMLYQLMVVRPSLRHFLQRSLETRVDEAMLSYAFATSHQPGAQHAPLAFLLGSLFPEGDPRQVYGQVRAPSLVLYDQDPYTSFTELSPFLARHPNFRAQRVQHTRGLPQLDAPQQTTEALRAFYGELDQTARHTVPVGLSFGAGRFVGSA